MSLFEGPAQGFAEADDLGVVACAIAHQEPNARLARSRLRVLLSLIRQACPRSCGSLVRRPAQSTATCVVYLDRLSFRLNRNPIAKATNPNTKDGPQPARRGSRFPP